MFERSSSSHQAVSIGVNKRLKTANKFNIVTKSTNVSPSGHAVYARPRSPVPMTRLLPRRDEHVGFDLLPLSHPNQKLFPKNRALYVMASDVA